MLLQRLVIFLDPKRHVLSVASVLPDEQNQFLLSVPVNVLNDKILNEPIPLRLPSNLSVLTAVPQRKPSALKRDIALVKARAVRILYDPSRQEAPIPP